jgi:hypothetical protein
MSVNEQRLLQALANYQRGTKGGEVPKGVEEAIKGLQGALSEPAPSRDTPGMRAALSVAPGTKGTGEPISKAAKGVDGPSPGQTEAKSVSQQIAEAAASIVEAQK